MVRRFSEHQIHHLDNFAEDIRTDDQNVYTVPAVISRVRQVGQFSAGEEAGHSGVSRRLKRVDLSGSRLSSADLSECSAVYFAMDELEFATLKRALHTTSREKLEKFIEILFKVHLIQELSEEDRRGRITALFDRLLTSSSSTIMSESLSGFCGRFGVLRVEKTE